MMRNPKYNPREASHVSSSIKTISIATMELFHKYGNRCTIQKSTLGKETEISEVFEG